MTPSSPLRTLFRRPLLAAFFLLLALISTRILSSPDLGWHLRAGERIIEERAIPDSDTFSSTRQGERWWVNQPLAEIVFYAVDHRFGGSGLVALRFLLALALFVLLHRSGRLAGGGSEVVTGGVLLLALLASASHMILRPFLLSAVLLAATGLIVESYRREKGDRLALLPILFAVWAQIHPGFLYGVALLGVYCAGEWIRAALRAVRGDVKAMNRKRWRRLVIFSLLSVAAALVSGAAINPSGVTAVLLPIGLLKTRFFFQVLSEFQPADWWRDRFFTALFLVVALSLIRGKRRDATEMIAVAVFGLFAVRAVRVILPFAVVAAPIAMRNWMPPVARLLPDRSRRGRVLRLAGAAGALFLVAWWWRNDPLRFPLPSEMSGTIEESCWAEANYPERAFSFIKKRDLPGEVFHPDQFGGAFIRYFYPNRKNFVDGRVEVYGEDFWKNDYFRILGGGPGWEEELRRYNVNTLLLRSSPATGRDPVNRLAAASDEWALVYFDDVSEVYVRRGAMEGPRLVPIELKRIDPTGGFDVGSYEEEAGALGEVSRLFMWNRHAGRLLYVYARLLEEREEWDEVDRAIDDGALARPGDDPIRRELRRIRGEARFRLGNREGARSDWKKAGDGVAARNDRALLKWLSDGDARRFLPMSPGTPPADELVRLASLLRGAREWRKAIELSRLALDASGGGTYYRNNLAWTLLEGEDAADTEEALSEAGEATRLAPDDGYCRGTLARALLASGDTTGAVWEIREAIRLLPADDFRTGAKERGNLALLLARRDDLDAVAEALDLAEEALRMDLETKDLRKLVLLLVERGETERLDRLAEEAFRIDGETRMHLENSYRPPPLVRIRKELTGR